MNGLYLVLFITLSVPIIIWPSSFHQGVPTNTTLSLSLDQNLAQITSDISVPYAGHLQAPSPAVLDWMKQTAKNSCICEEFIVLESPHHVRAGADVVPLISDPKKFAVIIQTTDDLSCTNALSFRDTHTVAFEFYFGYAHQRAKQRNMISDNIAASGKWALYIAALGFLVRCVPGYIALSFLYPRSILCALGLVASFPLLVDYATDQLPDVEYYKDPESFLWALDQVTQNFGPDTLRQQLDSFLKQEYAWSYNPLFYLRPHRKIIGKALIAALYHAQTLSCPTRDKISRSC